MKKKTKNWITNILGILVICGAMYKWWIMEDLTYITFGLIVGLALFASHNQVGQLALSALGKIFNSDNKAK